MAPKTLWLKRKFSSISMVMLLALLVTLAPSYAQTEGGTEAEKTVPSAQPAPSPAPVVAPAEQPPAPTTEQPPAPTTEPPAPTTEQPPAPANPDPATSPTPSIEDLYAPDLPKKPDKTPSATEEPKSKEPVLYISDSDNGRIVVMQGIGGEGFTSVGLPGYGLGRFLRPAQIWLDYAA